MNDHPSERYTETAAKAAPPPPRNKYMVSSPAGNAVIADVIHVEFKEGWVVFHFDHLDRAKFLAFPGHRVMSVVHMEEA